MRWLRHIDQDRRRSCCRYQIDDLGIDYIDRRNSLIDAVTLDDAKRVAKRLLDGGMLVTVVVGRVAQPTAN